MVATPKKLDVFQQRIEEVFADLGEFTFRWRAPRDDFQDVAVTSPETGKPYLLRVKIRQRITPQIADDLFSRLKTEPLPGQAIRVVYAPVISPRVVEIARRHGISYLDAAGNCKIVAPESGLLISRSGLKTAVSAEKSSKTDPFSPKSSRVVRVMLHEPIRGWQLTELAEHPDVGVSIGLVHKIKVWLIRENYAVESGQLLYLNRPGELLNAWSRSYSGAAGERSFYVRGETAEIEQKLMEWLTHHGLTCALARFSAAWKLAPEVRYSVASIYVDNGMLQPDILESLRTDCGVKDVDSGANLLLLTPFDESVFAQTVSSPLPATSPLQTYLDLQTAGGRGTEAAEAIYEKYLRDSLESSNANGVR